MAKAELSDLELHVARYRDGALMATLPSALMGLMGAADALYLVLRKGHVFSGMVLLLSGLAMISGAWSVVHARQSQGLRGVVLSAVGAVVASVLVALGLALGKLSLLWTMGASALFLSGPAFLLLSYCYGAAVEAAEKGMTTVETLRTVPRSTFATVERPVLYVVEVSALLVFVVLLNWTKVQPGRFKRYDLSALKPGQRVYALSSKTKKVLADLNRDVHVVVFMTPPQSPDQDSIYEDVRELLTRFASGSPHIHVEYIDLHRQLERAKALAQKYRLNLADAADIESGIGGLVVFVSGDKQKYVNANDMAEFDYKQDSAGQYHQKVKAFKAEEAFLNALLNVTRSGQARLCLTQGHNEPKLESYGPNGIGYAAEMIRREGIKVEGLDRLDKGVPKRCDILAVVGPTVALSSTESDAIDEYLASGGRLLFIPATAMLVGNVPQFVKSGLEPILVKYGIVVEDAFAVDMSLRTVQPLIWIADKTWGKHPIANVMKGRRIVLSMPRAFRIKEGNGYKASVLLQTTDSDQAWGETDLNLLVDERVRLAYDAKSDLKSPVAVAVASRSDKKNGFRVVAFGGLLNVLNRNLDPNQPVQDFSSDLLLNSLNWLLERAQLIALSPRVPERVKLELTQAQISRIFRVTVLGMPLFAMLLGLLVWWVRRN